MVYSGLKIGRRQHEEILGRFSHLEISLDAAMRLINDSQSLASQIAPQEPLPLQREAFITADTFQQQGFSNIHGPLPGPLDAYCDPYCPCHCHQVSIAAPLSWVEPILGKLVVRSNLSPFFRKPPCNYPHCKAPVSSATVNYTSPSWFMRREFQLRMSWGCLSGAGATLHLRVPRIVGKSIFQAIKTENEGTLRRVLSLGDISSADIDDDGKPIMRYALAYAMAVKPILLLFNTGFDTGISDSQGTSGISMARWRLRYLRTRRDNEEAALLRKIGYGGEALTTVPVRLSKIHRALFTGDDRKLADALQSCLPVDLDAYDECGFAPIHYAVTQDRIEALRMLLEAGADPNLDSAGGSALVIAAHRFFSSEILRLLLDYKADTNKLNRFGYGSAIMATVGQPVKMRMLLDAGAHAVVPNSRIETPLHFFMGYYNLPYGGLYYEEDYVEESIHMLLKARVGIDQRDAAGRTPLMMAICRCDSEATRVLLRIGARTDLLDEADWNILHYAAVSRDKDIIDVLRSAVFSNVDPHQPDVDGDRPYDVEQSPLPSWAATCSHERFVVFCYAIGWKKYRSQPTWKHVGRYSTWYNHQRRRRNNVSEYITCFDYQRQQRGKRKRRWKMQDRIESLRGLEHGITKGNGDKSEESTARRE